VSTRNGGLDDLRQLTFVAPDVSGNALIPVYIRLGSTIQSYRT
jgi:hypothetical protein